MSNWPIVLSQSCWRDISWQYVNWVLWCNLSLTHFLFLQFVYHLLSSNYVEASNNVGCNSFTLTTVFVKKPTFCARAQNRIRGFSTIKDLGDVVGPKLFVRTSRAVFHNDVTWRNQIAWLDICSCMIGLRHLASRSARKHSLISFSLTKWIVNRSLASHQLHMWKYFVRRAGCWVWFGFYLWMITLLKRIPKLWWSTLWHQEVDTMREWILVIWRVTSCSYYSASFPVEG
jgi:hypothetical protein